MENIRLIKKYPNRRLYDTTESRYITLDEIRKLVLEFIPFRVIDARSQENVTSYVLLQIINEQETGQHHSERQVVFECGRVDFSCHFRMCQDRLRLGTKQEHLAVAIKIKWLDTDTVASQDKLAPRSVPEGEREHPAKFMNEIFAHLFVKMDDHFCITLCMEPVSPGFEFAPQFLKIVDLAVEDHLDRPVLVTDGLVATSEVDDREPAVDQA